MNELNEQPVIWGADGWADSSGFTLAYIADPETSEYLGTNNVWVSEGTSLPAGAYLDAPPAKESGQTIIRQADGWQLVTDLRGVVVYDKSTGHPVTVNAIGELQEQYTLLEPSSPYDKWSGEEWVKDESAEQQAKLEASQAEQLMRINEANQQIAILMPAIDGGYAKQEHIQLLADWQRYRYDVALVSEQPDWLEKPQWPERPPSVV